VTKSVPFINCPIVTYLPSQPGLAVPFRNDITTRV
jgi:hypothetical protein